MECKAAFDKPINIDNNNKERNAYGKTTTITVNTLLCFLTLNQISQS
jgi:hypothetical protein